METVIFPAIVLQNLGLKQIESSNHIPSYGTDAPTEIWSNDIGNFLLINNFGIWDIYFGCDSFPVRIKSSVKSFDTIKSLYNILLNLS